MSGRPAGKGAVSLRDFLTAVVQAANEGHGQAWVANELGVSSAAVSLRLKSLRDKGVKVPSLTTVRGNVADEANDILADLGIE